MQMNSILLLERTIEMQFEPRINKTLKNHYYEQGYWGTDTILDVWLEQASTFASREYIVASEEHRLTYREIDDHSSRLATWLYEIGVCEGDVVSFQIPIWPEFIVTYLACLKVGAVMHPVSLNINCEDLKNVLVFVESTALICAKEYRGIDREKCALSIKDEVPSLKSICIIEHGITQSSSYPSFESIIQTKEPLSVTPTVSPDDVALILFTSGSTGGPKAVLLTHNNLLFSERQFTEELGLTGVDIMFMPAPLNHATGFNHGLLAPMILGGKTVLQQDFCAKEAIDIMNREGVTWSMGATPFIFDILNTLSASGKRLETLRFYLCGGAPLPSTMIQRAKDLGIVLCEVYGSTESCPHAYVPPHLALEWNGRFSGKSLKGIEIRVVDELGNDVSAGEQGEELSRGPNVFVGYLKNQADTDLALSHDGWFYSGDLCIADEEGRIRINGRKKDIIVRGGLNISIPKIEEKLLGCPGIKDLAVIGKPDQRLGERICLFAVVNDGPLPTLKGICDFLKTNDVVKKFWPEHLEFINAIPRTESGKTKRNLLAQILEQRMLNADDTTKRGGGLHV